MTLEQPMKTSQNVPKTSAIYDFMGSLLVHRTAARADRFKNQLKESMTLRRRFRRVRRGLITGVAGRLPIGSKRLMAAIVTLRRGSEADIPFIMATERLEGYGELVGRWEADRHLAALGDGRHAYFVAERGGRAGRLRAPARLGVAGAR